MSTVHRNLTGADLHEPKGADTALSGSVYVANGSGSGVWTDASTIITNTAFSTGDLKITHKVTADTGWILWTEGSIGDGSSSATIRANSDTVDLFTLYWNNYSNTLCPVSGGRGGSAAADFAAHKRLTIPAGNARALGIAGVATGLTTRTIGDGSIGSETKSLVTANLPPYTPAGTNGTVSVNTSRNDIAINNGTSSTGGGGFSFGISTGTGVQVNSTGTGPTFTGTPQGGTSTAFSIMPPMAYVNVMIKL